MEQKPILGITMGDPFGNGPEITVKALAVYADHPAHIEAKTHFFPWVQTRVAADYEV